MKILMVGVILAAGALLAPSAGAQLVHLRGSSENVTLPTPQQLEVNKQIDKWNNAADDAMNAGKYAEAEADIRKADALAPGGYIAGGKQGVLAAALDAQGKDKEALALYKMLVEGTNIPDFLLPYALLQIKNGQYAAAVAAYNKALPNLPYGGLMRAQGELDAATVQPTELETACHLALGLVYYDHGIVRADSRFDLAFDQFEKALQLTPDSALAKLYLGYSMTWLNMKAQARTAFATAAARGEGDVKKQAIAAMHGRSIDP